MKTLLAILILAAGIAYAERKVVVVEDTIPVTEVEAASVAPGDNVTVATNGTIYTVSASNPYLWTNYVNANQQKLTNLNYLTFGPDGLVLENIGTSVLNFYRADGTSKILSIGTAGISLQPGYYLTGGAWNFFIGNTFDANGQVINNVGAIITTNLNIVGGTPASNAVFTCTNAVTGAGEWVPRIAFAARAQNTATVLPDAVYTSVTYDVEDYDYGSGWNGRTYTAPRGGVYNFNANAAIVSLPAGCLVAVQITTNTAQAATVFSRIGAAGYGSVAISADLELTAGEAVEFRFYQNSALTKTNFTAVNFYNTAGGHLIK